MTQTSKTVIDVPVTAEQLKALDTDTIAVRTQSGDILGDVGSASITWGIHNSFDGDYEGFATFLNEFGAAEA